MSVSTDQNNEQCRKGITRKKFAIVLALSVFAGFLALSKLNDFIIHKKSEADLKCAFYCMMAIYAQN